MPDNNELIKQQARYISHEIRNQLSISDVYCEVLKKHLDKINIKDDAITKAINCIQKSTKLIGNSLLDLKSLTNLNPQVVNLNKIIEESIELSKVYIFEKNIDIISKLDSDTQVYIDDNKLEACLLNIIKNAIEAIDLKGTIIIETKNSKDNVKIIISNNGKAIPKKTQAEIFNDGHTTKPTGSGIGLYLCKNNLNAQNADLKLVESNNKKTIFEIILPILHV